MPMAEYIAAQLRRLDETQRALVATLAELDAHPCVCDHTGCSIAHAESVARLRVALDAIRDELAESANVFVTETRSARKGGR